MLAILSMVGYGIRLERINWDRLSYNHDDIGDSIYLIIWITFVTLALVEIVVIAISQKVKVKRAGSLLSKASCIDERLERGAAKSVWEGGTWGLSKKSRTRSNEIEAVGFGGRGVNMEKKKKAAVFEISPGFL